MVANLGRRFQGSILDMLLLALNEFTGVQCRCMVANLGLRLLGSVMGTLFH